MTDTNSTDSDRPTVPYGVIEAIEQLQNGETADGDDLDDALNW